MVSIFKKSGTLQAKQSEIFRLEIGPQRSSHHVPLRFPWRAGFFSEEGGVYRAVYSTLLLVLSDRVHCVGSCALPPDRPFVASFHVVVTSPAPPQSVGSIFKPKTLLPRSLLFTFFNFLGFRSRLVTSLIVSGNSKRSWVIASVAFENSQLASVSRAFVCCFGLPFARFLLCLGDSAQSVGVFSNKENTETQTFKPFRVSF